VSLITSYPSLASPASDDVLPIVDVHDTTMSPSGTTKQVAVSSLVGAAGRLIPTGVKTGGYTAAPGDFVRVSTASATVTITLPAAPADQSAVAVKLVTQGGTNAVTIAAAGTDVFNVGGGITSLTLARLFQTVTFQYVAANHVWLVTSSDPALTLDSTATDIAPPGNQAAGITGMGADAGHVHPATGWTPADHGLAAWSYDPILIAANGAPTSGTIYLLGLKVRRPLTVSNIYFVLGSTAAAGVTAGQNFVGLYSSTTRLAQVATDASFGGGADTLVTCGITAQALTPGNYWVAFLMTATTMPTLGNMWAAINSTSAYNLGLTAANYRSASGGTAQTALPASTPTLTIAGKGYWTAIG
jgi:hypothetical protein